MRGTYLQSQISIPQFQYAVNQFTGPRVHKMTSSTEAIDYLESLIEKEYRQYLNEGEVVLMQDNIQGYKDVINEIHGLEWDIHEGREDVDQYAEDLEDLKAESKTMLEEIANDIKSMIMDRSSLM